MTRRRKVLLACLLILAAGLAWLVFKPNPYRAAAEALRQSLREQGFKIEYADFDLSLSDEELARFRTLTNAGVKLEELEPDIPPLPLVQPVEDCIARVTWRESVLPSDESTNLWPLASGYVPQGRDTLNTATAVILQGPVRSIPLSMPHAPASTHGRCRCRSGAGAS